MNDRPIVPLTYEQLHAFLSERKDQEFVAGHIFNCPVAKALVHLTSERITVAGSYQPDGTMLYYASIGRAFYAVPVWLNQFLALVDGDALMDALRPITGQQALVLLERVKPE